VVFGKPIGSGIPGSTYGCTEEVAERFLPESSSKIAMLGELAGRWQERPVAGGDAVDSGKRANGKAFETMIPWRRDGRMVSAAKSKP